jgi:hypothetical protein
VTINVTRNTKSVSIEDLLVTNEDFFSLISSQPESKRQQTVLDVIAVGSTAMLRVETALDVDFVEKRFTSLSAKFENGLVAFERQAIESVQKRFSPTEAGSPTKFIADLVAAVKKDVHGWTNDLAKTAKDLLDPDKKTSGVSRLEAVLDEATGRFESMFDPDEKDSYAARLNLHLSVLFGGDDRPGVLGKALKTALEPLLKEIHELKEKVEARRAAEQIIANTTIKGFDFESEVERKLCGLARPHGDTVQAVGTGPSAAKAGDFVVELVSSKRRLAVEARAGKMSGPTIKDDLKRAMTARSADFGILVVRSADLLPEYVGHFQIYDHQIVTAFDGLEAAYRVARIMLELDNMQNDGVDALAILSKLNQIRDALNKERNIRTEVTKVESAVQNIRGQAMEMSTRIVELIMQIEAMLRSDQQSNAA